MTWTTFSPRRRIKTVEIAQDTVRLLRDGSVVLSPDLVERLGAPGRVTLLTNIDPTRIGIRAFADAATEQPYRLIPYSRTQGSSVHIYTLLWRLGRRNDEPRVLPHAWDGNVLVVDVSSVPEREVLNGC